MLLKSRGPAVGHQRPRAPTSSSLSAPGQPQFSTILAANLTGSNERNAAVTTRGQLLPGHPQGVRAESQDPQTQGPDVLRAADRVEAQRETEVPQSPRPESRQPCWHNTVSLLAQTPQGDSEIFEEDTPTQSSLSVGHGAEGQLSLSKGRMVTHLMDLLILCVSI